MGLEIESHAGRKVDWNTNDFDLADSIRHMADHFIGALTTLGDTVDGFESLFPTVADQKQTLLSFAGKVTESNYIEKVDYLLTNSDQFSTAIQTILKTQKFIKKNFSKVEVFKRFIEEVVSELKKADRTDNSIQEAHEEFNRLYKQDMVKNFGSLQQQVQIVKDSYYKLIKNAAAGMSHEYQLLCGKVDAALRTLKGYPAELNVQNQKKLDELKRYCSDRVIKEPVLEYAITCRNCGYSLSDILNYTALAPNKESDLLIIQSSFIAEAPKPDTPTAPNEPKLPRKMKLNISGQKMTVGEYRKVLSGQLQSLAGMNDADEIELEID